MKYFSEIGQCCRPALKYQKSVSQRINYTIIYLSIGEYFRLLLKLMQAGARTQMTDRHFLDLSEKCLYMVHFDLGPFFENCKKLSTQFHYKNNPRSLVYDFKVFQISNDKPFHPYQVYLLIFKKISNFFSKKVKIIKIKYFDLRTLQL